MKAALLFPGQGSQYVGMGKELVKDFPLARRLFEEANDILGYDLQSLCLFGPEEHLKQTKHTQPAILTVSTATFRVLQEETDLPMDLVAGHSLGEYSALVAAGALNFSQAVKAVYKRGEYMQEAVPEGEGAMAALIGTNPEAAEKLCEEVKQNSETCEIANYNGGGQIVLSGHKKAIQKAIALTKENPGIRKAVLLPVSAPFHCSLMKPAAIKLLPFLEKLEIHSLKVPYIPNVSAKICRDKGEIAKNLYEQIAKPVLWEQSMGELTSIERCLELGPNKVLTNLLARINKNLPCTPMEVPPKRTSL